jgi:hypothetical protein
MVHMSDDFLKLMKETMGDTEWYRPRIETYPIAGDERNEYVLMCFSRRLRGVCEQTVYKRTKMHLMVIISVCRIMSDRSDPITLNSEMSDQQRKNGYFVLYTMSKESGFDSMIERLNSFAENLDDAGLDEAYGTRNSEDDFEAVVGRDMANIIREARMFGGGA